MDESCRRRAARPFMTSAREAESLYAEASSPAASARRTGCRRSRRRVESGRVLSLTIVCLGGVTCAMRANAAMKIMGGLLGRQVAGCGPRAAVRVRKPAACNPQPVLLFQWLNEFEAACSWSEVALRGCMQPGARRA